MAARIAITSLGLVALLTGCAAKSPPSVDTGAPARPLMTGAENGLEVRRLTVLDRGHAIGGTLTRHADQHAINTATDQDLARNGFRFVRVPVAAVDQIANDLGGAMVDQSQWHGQVHEWRSLEDRPVGPGGKALVIDGKVRRFDRGDFRLMIRSWTVQMEDGPIVHLEVLPQHRRPQPTNIRRLLGEDAEAAEAFASMALDLQLESGFAYVLLGESPAVDWSGSSTPPSSSAPPKPKPAASRVGPDVGPEAAPPLTLGEWLLLPSRNPPTRDLLVFVPRVSPNLFAQQSNAAFGASAAGQELIE